MNQHLWRQLKLTFSNFVTPPTVFNPLSNDSDESEISLYTITTCSNI